MVVSALVLVSLLLSGCDWFRRDGSTLDIDFSVYLPAEWTPIENWKDVNIDNDDTMEHLLFYRYESGQVGGVIYDPQTNTDFAPMAEAAPIFALPNQPSIMMIPYRLLPSYWNGAGQGFLAAPDQIPTFIQVQRSSNEVDTTELDDQGNSKENERTDELIIFGGDQYLSVFWWRGPDLGYGVTHLAAPGGLKITDWAGKDNASAILTVDGYFPEENNRNLICRKVSYERSMAADAGSRQSGYRFALDYVPHPQGLTFCPSDSFAENTPYPAHTFYPEATALAYLLHTQEDRQNEKIMQDLIKPSAMAKVGGLVGEVKRIQSVTYYVALTEISSTLQTTNKSELVMQVVAELVIEQQDSDPPSPNAELAAAKERLRFVTFFLEHQPPVLDPLNTDDRRSDRWLIIDAIDP